MSTKKIRKFNDLIFYLVAKFGDRGVVETKLMKLLYFSEANYYERRNRTISGIAYFKNNYGPTPDFKVLQETLSSLKDFIKVEKKTFNKRKIKIFRVINKDYSYGNLEEDERQEIDKTFDLYGDLPSDQLSKLSHLDPPFLASDKEILFRYVRHRKEEENQEEAFSLEESEKFKEDLKSENLERLFNYAKQIS